MCRLFSVIPSIGGAYSLFPSLSLPLGGAREGIPPRCGCCFSLARSALIGRASQLIDKKGPRQGAIGHQLRGKARLHPKGCKSMTQQPVTRRSQEVVGPSPGYAPALRAPLPRRGATGSPPTGARAPAQLYRRPKPRAAARRPARHLPSRSDLTPLAGTGPFPGQGSGRTWCWCWCWFSAF